MVSLFLSTEHARDARVSSRFRMESETDNGFDGESSLTNIKNKNNIKLT